MNPHRALSTVRSVFVSSRILFEHHVLLISLSWRAIQISSYCSDCTNIPNFQFISNSNPGVLVFGNVFHFCSIMCNLCAFFLPILFCVSINSNFKNSSGGASDDDFLNELFYFDLVALNWTAVRNNLPFPSPRAYFSIDTLGLSLYIYGGVNQFNTLVSTYKMVLFILSFCLYACLYVYICMLVCLSHSIGLCASHLSTWAHSSYCAHLCVFFLRQMICGREIWYSTLQALIFLIWFGPKLT